MSASSVSWNGDIGTRHERLASEYQKLRAQASVLKKGVLDERVKSEKLAEDLRAAETVVRKMRSENESLSFRNEQLVKRMAVVQDEMEELQRRSSATSKKKENKKHQKGSSEREHQLEASLAVLEEELKNKLERNEKLASRVSEVERLNDTLTEELRELKERFLALDTALLKAGEAVRTGTRGGGGNPFENGLSSLSSRAPSPSCSLSSSEAASTGGIAVPPSPPTTAEPSPFWVAAESSTVIVGGLSTLLSLLEQRSRIYPYDATLERVPARIEKLGSDLSECSRLFASALESTTAVFEEPSEKWQSLALAACTDLEKAASASGEMLPEGLSMLSQEESKGAWSDATLEALNERWRLSLAALLTEVSSFALPLRVAIEAGERGASTADIAALSTGAAKLHAVVKATQESFSARLLVETRLPVQTKKGKCVGAATRDCLRSLVVECNKASLRLSALAAEREKEDQARRDEEEKEKIRAELQREHDDALAALQGADGQEEEDGTVPKITMTSPSREDEEEGATAAISRKTSGVYGKGAGRRLEKRSITATSTAGDDTCRLQSELDTLRTRVRELESERERLLLDCVLARRKAEAAGTTKAEEREDSPAPSTQSHSTDDLGGVSARVAEVEKHFAARLRVSADRLIRSEARGDYFSRECETLARSTRGVHAEKRRLAEQIGGLMKDRDTLKDELLMTRSGFEAQLREMTEHVAEINAEKEARERAALAATTNPKNTLSRRLQLFK